MTYKYCFQRPIEAQYEEKKGGVLCQEKAHSRLCSLRKKKHLSKLSPANIRHRIEMSCAPKLSSLLPPAGTIRALDNGSIYHGKSLPSGANASSRNVWQGSRSGQGAVARAFFPPEIVIEVKALACQLPRDLGLPFSHLTREEIAREAMSRGIVASISGATVWRWLAADAIRPWCYRSWIWPRDPHFERKAGRVLDLYQGTWEGKSLGKNDYVICADEKTSIQARERLVPTTPPCPGHAGRVEHEYKRRGALAYLAGWDVHRAKVFGLCRPCNGIDSFHDLVDHVMTREPYSSARRVFWITDNGSSHRGEGSIQRLCQWYPNAILVHTPVHASWLNQIEIYFSVVQRKVLTPNDFAHLAELEGQILSFQSHYEKSAEPFEWKFTRQDLKRLLHKLPQQLVATAA